MDKFSFKIKNYKCFGDEPQGFDKILPINIIIGKNNSGKSSLLELVKTMANSTNFDIIKKNFPKLAIIYTSKLTESTIKDFYPENLSGGNISGPNYYHYGKDFVGETITAEWGYDNGIKFIGSSKPIKIPNNRRHEELVRINSHPFKGKIIKSINAERDIKPEAQAKNLALVADGKGATALAQEIINSAEYDSTWIESLLLKGLNSITYPEIQFTRILTQNTESNVWEIYLEDKNGVRIALSKMGSGIKTILQVLLNLIVIPKLEKKQENEYIFLFEELENNLHPSLQRRLFNFIKDFALRFESVFFITTHSNVVIDSFGANENAQIIHISDSVTNNVNCSKGINRVLDDLEIKASDIFQSNGIIWVEGPSDRHYLNKWINLIAPELKEGLHYSIMFYGGKLLSTITFSYFESELIPLLKINRNSFVIIDKDRRNINEDINKTKKRINEELGGDKCWITSGIEIENYLTDSTINKWLNSKEIKKPKFKGDKFEKFEVKIKSNYKIPYAQTKNLFAKEIINFITKDDLDLFDLKLKIDSIVLNIKKWNKLISSEIEIIRATYGIPSKLIDITEIILEQVSRGIIHGPVDPSTFGIPDPIFGTVKTLSIHCKLNGIEKKLVFYDTDKVFKIE